MNFEKLNAKNKNVFLFYLLCGVVLLVAVCSIFSYAKYQNIEDIELVKGEVNYKIPDFKMMAMYQNNNGSYEEVSELPGKNYKINESKSYCTINNVDKDDKAKLYTNKYGQHVIGNISKNDKCYLYFDKNTEIVNTVLGSIEVNNYTPDFSLTATTDEGIFKAEDNDGISYYWRGAATTNYLKFGGYCWRIIRINGDGTIRLIYDGTTCHNNGEVTTDSIAVANIAYNAAFGKSEYVGWTYTEGLQRPNSTIEGTNAPIKTVLENWYNNNLKSYEEKIADGKFCNDRNVQSGQSWSSTSSNTYYYAPNARTYTNYAPTLCCTVLDTYILKVGLIISDEVMYAGGKNVDNDSYYLYNGQNYWTMTPHSWLVGTAASWVWAFYVHSTGYFNAYGVDNKFGVRPVINLRSDINISGNGTKDNPYVVLN